MNDTQTAALQHDAAELQARIDDLTNQRQAAVGTIESADFLLPELQAQLDALKEGLPEVTPA